MARVFLMSKETLHARKATIETTTPLVCTHGTHARTYEKSDFAELPRKLRRKCIVVSHELCVTHVRSSW